MKKIYLSVITLAVMTSLSAQHQTAVQEFPSTLIPLNISSSRAIDTLEPVSNSLTCFTSDPTPFVFYGAGAGNGFVSGNNIYGHKALGHEFNIPSGNVVTKVLVGVKTTNTSNSNITVSLHQITGGVVNATPAGTSTAKALSTLPANGFTTFEFATPVSITGDVLFSVNLPTGTGDTLVVFSTKHMCADPDNKSWYQAGNNSFAKLSTFWNAAPSTPLLIDLAIYPIVSNPVGLNENALSDISVWEYNRQLFVDTHGEYSNGTISITNIMGQVVESFNFNDSFSVVELNNLASGIYVATIAAEGKRITRKISVN